jgi:hypothetical protein
MPTSGREWRGFPTATPIADLASDGGFDGKQLHAPQFGDLRLDLVSRTSTSADQLANY